MADSYDNLINITITAIDQASEVIAGITAQIEDAQKALTDSATTTTEEVSTANDEMAANFQEASDAIKQSLGEIGVAGDGLVADMDTLVGEVDSRNAMIIASFTAMKDSIKADMSEISLSENVGFESGNLGKLGLGGLGSLTGMSTMGNVILGGAAAAAFSVYEAANFQQSLTRLYTTAGEVGNKNQIGAGISAISAATGQNVIDLTSGKNGQPGAMYYISSAGYNNLSGLQVLKPVAQASAMEGANPADVANALTTMMRDYGASPGQATSYMNMLMTSIARGKTTLQQTSTALPSFLTGASAAKLNPTNVLAYFSTLTSAGVSSNQAGQDINAIIRELSGGFTTQESTALQNLGLNPVNIESGFSKMGIAQTVNMIEQAVLSHMKGGKVLLGAFQNSTIATQNLNTEIASAPADVRSLAEQLVNGQMSYGAFRQYASMLPGRDRSIAEQIATTYNQTQSFNKALTSNKPLAQTYLSENQQIFGQGDARNAAIIGEQHYQQTLANQKAIQQAAQNSSKNVEGWSKYQGTLNAQIKEFEQGLLGVSRSLGKDFLPGLTTVLRVTNLLLQGHFSKFFEDIGKAVIDNVPFLKTEIGWLENIIAWFMELGPKIGKAVSHLWTDVKKDFDSFNKQISGFFGSLVSGVVDSFTQLPGKIGDAITKGAKALGKGASNFIGGVSKDVTGFFSSLGIPGLASGTMSAQGGLTLVGENGPELVQMPAGARVYNDSETQAILNRGAASVSGGGQATTINLSVNVGNFLGTPADQQKLAKQIYQSLQNIARQHGMASSLPNIGVLPQ